MLKEFYRLRGWDETTGLPTPKTVAALGMEDVAQAAQNSKVKSKKYNSKSKLLGRVIKF